MAQNPRSRKTTIQRRLERERLATLKDPEGKKAFTKGLGTTAELLAYGVPVGVVGNLSAKAAAKLLTKYKNFKNTQKVYRGTTQQEKGARTETGRYYTPYKDTAIKYGSRGHLDLNPKFTGVVLSKRIPKKQVKIGQKVAQRRYDAGKTKAMLSNELMLPKQYVGKTKVDIPATIQARAKSLKDTLLDMTNPKMYKFSRDAEKRITHTSKGELVLTPYGKKMLKAENKAIPKMKKGGTVKKTKSHRGDGIAKRGRTKGRII